MYDDDDLAVVSEAVVEPMWYRYATFVRGTSNKFYEVSIDLGNDGRFILTRRWGRRPDDFRGSHQQENYLHLQTAISTALDLFQSKLAKGYVVTERPTL